MCISTQGRLAKSGTISKKRSVAQDSVLDQFNQLLESIMDLRLAFLLVDTMLLRMLKVFKYLKI